MNEIGRIILRIVCLLIGHRWTAMVFGDHVALYCDRCGMSTDAEFRGPQPYVDSRFAKMMDDVISRKG